MCLVLSSVSARRGVRYISKLRVHLPKDGNYWLEGLGY